MPAISQFVVKLHSRCDLSCDHCYIYEHADQSWRARPAMISFDTVSRAASRVAEHAKRHALPAVHVVLHGGEPLLLGPVRMAETLGILRSAIAPVAKLDLRVHTNAVRLSREFCRVFDEYGVKVGVSLDGGRQANDTHRRFADGRSSHAHVLRSLELLRRPEYRHLYAGILCTIDTRHEPIAVYEALTAQEPPRIDFLLPHATWADPPARHHGGPAEAEYARWLLTIHRRWRADGRPVPIRIFDSLEALASGGPTQTEAVGADGVDFLVIETDGAYEQADSLKIAYPGAPSTGFDVFSHSVDEAAAHRGLAARRSGFEALSLACRGCLVVNRCGGGLYAHRYKPGSGFDNPSVYCEDLQILVENIPPRDGGHRAGPEEPSSSVSSSTAAHDLAEGLDSPAALKQLAILQIRINRAVVAVAAQEETTRDPLAAAAWDVLVRLEQQAPHAVADVFAHAHLRVRVGRRAREDDLDVLRPAGSHLLESLALSAAVRARVREHVEVRPSPSILYLPDIGSLALPEEKHRLTIMSTECGLVVNGSGGRSVIDLGAAGTAQSPWRSVAALHGEGLTVTLDDCNPHRDCFGWPAADHAGADETARWQRDFTGAVDFLAAHMPIRAECLRACVRTIVPLAPDPAGRLRSASAWNAFGSIGVARPGDPESLALLLSHELQHVKLAALMDVSELYDKADYSRYRVPWRDDLRPLQGVLHGAYAHVAVTEFWHVQSRIRRAEAARRAAEREFTRRRRETVETLTWLLAPGRLTETGRIVVERALLSMDQMADV